MPDPLKQDGPCYYCNKPTISHAGNPGLWPVMLCHADDPGKVKHHHVQCVSERLAKVEQMKLSRTRLLDAADDLIADWQSGNIQTKDMAVRLHAFVEDVRAAAKDQP